MAQPGQKLGDPNGEQVVFRRTSTETGGELLEVEAIYAPRSSRPPAHFHPNQQETFTVLEGTMTASIGRAVRRYAVGDSFTVPAGVVHWMHNADDGPARVRWETRPALATERFFETVFGLARDEKFGAGGKPNVLQMAVVLMAHRNEFRLASPPTIVQAVVLPVLAGLGRLAGYDPQYDSTMP